MTTTNQQSIKEDKAAIIKSLKSTSDVETFYRFILDNNLRAEAYTLIKMVSDVLTPQKAKRKSKKLQ